MAAVGDADIAYWLKELHELISPNFTRAEPRQRAWNYMCGLAEQTAPGGRRNIASYANERRADGAQRLLTMAQWDENEVRRNLLEVVKRYFGLANGGLYMTEGTFAKKGSDAVAVDRQFSVDNRRLENCQIALLMFYSTPGGALVLIDAEPYLPSSWLGDANRRRKASIPSDLGYRTKSQIVIGMIKRAMDAGLEPRMSSFSLLCSDKITLRRTLQERGIPYLIPLTLGEFESLSGMETKDPRLDVMTLTGRTPRSYYHGRPQLVEQYAAHSPSGRCSSHSAYYCAGTRRLISNGELSQLIIELKRMEARWRAIRLEIRLDRYEVRSWRGWHRHMTLAMAVQTAMELARQVPGRCG
ncbi:MAG: transposase [Pseudonocardiaceae bacterium]